MHLFAISNTFFFLPQLASAPSQQHANRKQVEQRKPLGATAHGTPSGYFRTGQCRGVRRVYLGIEVHACIAFDPIDSSVGLGAVERNACIVAWTAVFHGSAVVRRAGIEEHASIVLRLVIGWNEGRTGGYREDPHPQANRKVLREVGLTFEPLADIELLSIPVSCDERQPLVRLCPIHRVADIELGYLALPGIRSRAGKATARSAVVSPGLREAG